MSMLKSMSKEELIEEIYTRSYTKNYLHEAFLKDDIDYIASCLKASLSKYVMLKEKNWDKQTSLTTAINKYLRYNSTEDESLYKKFQAFCDEVDLELYSNGSKNFKEGKYYSYYLKDNDTSYVKYFCKIVNDRTLYETDLKYNEYIVERMPRYKKIYVLCRNKSNENIKEYEELIHRVLEETLETVDYKLDNKQIIKYINNKIRWMLLEETKKLDNYNIYRNNRRARLRDEEFRKNIWYVEKFIIEKWFGIEGHRECDIRDIEYLSEKHKKFIIDVVRHAKNINYSTTRYRKDKKGNYDICKTDIAKLLKITVNSLDKRCKRIREKVAKNIAI